MAKYALQCADCRNWTLVDDIQRRTCDYCCDVRQAEARRRYKDAQPGTQAQRCRVALAYAHAVAAELRRGAA